MECHLGRIDFMVGSVIYICVDTNYRESTQDTGFHSLFDTFSYCRDIFLRNSTADNSRFKLVSFLTVCIHRLEFNFTVTVLSTTTRLFCIFAVNVNRFCDSLFVSNLRSTYIGFYFELTKKTVNDDLQMKLTHTGDDRLACFLICMSTECWVFLCKFCKSFTQFALSCFCLRLDSQLDNRIREFHGLQDYRMLLVAECITCSSKFETDSGCNITRVNFIQFMTFVGMHLQDTSNTFFFTFCSVQDIRTGVHST